MSLLNSTRGSLLRITTFTDSGTWTKSNDLGFIVVEVTGLGGFGGPGSATDYGGGGGGGGYARRTLLGSELGATEDVTISSYAPLPTSFGVYCQAFAGGNGSAGGDGGLPGSGNGGDINLFGQNGSSGGAAGNSPMINGAGGITFGNGGDGRENSGGGGAGGAPGSFTGGNPGTGIVIVYEYSL